MGLQHPVIGRSFDEYIRNRINRWLKSNNFNIDLYSDISRRWTYSCGNNILLSIVVEQLSNEDPEGFCGYDIIQGGMGADI